MERKSRKVNKVVAVLTDPVPEYISLVERGANQTPFRVIRHAGGEVRQETSETAAKAASTVVDIHKMIFSKKQFKDAEAVSAYMDANGYLSYEIEDAGETYMIVGKSADELDGLEEITVKKGLTMTVGRTRAIRSGAPVQAPDVESSRKSMYSVSSMASVLSDIFYLMQDSEYEAQYEGDDSKIPAKLKEWLTTGASIFKELASEEVSEFVGMVTAAKAAKAQKDATVTTATTAPQDKKTTPVASPGKAPAAVRPNAPPTTTDKPVEPVVEAKPEETKVEETKPVETTAEVETQPEPAVAPGDNSPAETAVVEQKTAPAVDPMAALAAIIGEAVAKALEPVTTQLTEVKETVTKSASRIDAVEAGQRQTRKSGDHEDTSAPGTQATEQAKKAEADKAEAERVKKHAERQHRNALGI